MRHEVLLGLALAALAAPLAALAAGNAGAAGNVEGLWLTAPDRRGHVGRVEIAPCEEALCGTLVAVTGPDGRPAASDRLGTRILWGMRRSADGTYAGGRIFDPESGRDYAALMAPEGAGLRVSGCLMGICRGQVWRRAP